MAERPRPVLVTGMPRSATSWVGKMLAASGRFVYVNEPLNPSHPPGHSPGVLRAEVEHGFQYINEENEAAWLGPFRDTLRLRYQHLAELRRNRSPYDLARMAKYSSLFSAGRLRRRAALLDDPYAVLSAGWFARRLGCQVVVTLRDPVAIVSSWKRLGWTFDLGRLLAQPALRRDWLGPFEADMAAPPAGRDDLIGNVSLLWRLIYHIVRDVQAEVPEIRLVRHEDLSSDPVPAFARLYASLGLELTPKARQAVVDSTSGGKQVKSHPWTISRHGISRTGARRLDSRANLEAWKQRLTPDEVARVRELTADVAGRFYPPDRQAV